MKVWRAIKFIDFLTSLRQMTQIKGNISIFPVSMNFVLQALVGSPDCETDVLGNRRHMFWAEEREWDPLRVGRISWGRIFCPRICSLCQIAFLLLSHLLSPSSTNINWAQKWRPRPRSLPVWKCKNVQFTLCQQLNTKCFLTFTCDLRVVSLYWSKLSFVFTCLQFL